MRVLWKLRPQLRDTCASALAIAVLAMSVLAASPAAAGPVQRTTIRFVTVEGSFDVELFDDLMPNTVANFLAYVTSGDLDGTVVHRSVNAFVIQGGGFFLLDPVPPDDIIDVFTVVPNAPINDEPGGGVAGPSNVRGTIAMAKSGPNTATSQWFINLADNSSLDDPARPDGGFSAFGVVVGNGMTVVDAIEAVPTFNVSILHPALTNLPLRNFSGSFLEDIREVHTVVVTSVSVVPEPTSSVLATAGLAALVLVRGVRRSRV